MLNNYTLTPIIWAYQRLNIPENEHVNRWVYDNCKAEGANLDNTARNLWRNR